MNLLNISFSGANWLMNQTQVEGSDKLGDTLSCPECFGLQMRNLWNAVRFSAKITGCGLQTELIK